ncbi:MAG TPA: alpha/beta hydrolase [Solirubrobacterales bacterium]|nr:alpha/beta hydrolase [Solirubrobacterales bacterium]
MLHARDAGPRDGEPVLCVHGIAQNGSIFAALAEALAASGHRTVSVDLRGHGASTYEPPWNLATHAEDLLETAAEFGIGRATWIGHSFGGLVVATLAQAAPERVGRLALLDPGMYVPPPHALIRAERDRQDWSFTSAEGAVNALLASETVIATPREVLAAYAAADLVRGDDGRLRFRYSPAALATAWSEIALPPPPAAQVPTLLVRAVSSSLGSSVEDVRFRRELGSLLTMVAVPNGHNVLWEAPAETTAAVQDFLAATR